MARQTHTRPAAGGAGEQAPLVQPSIAEARKLAKSHNLIALRHSFIEDCETPVSAYLKLRELAPDEPAFLLESAEQGQRVGRYSLIGFRPRSTLRWSLAGLFLRYHMGLYDVGGAQLYVNTGTGFWLLPFRLGMTPEITLIELRRAPR